MKKYSTIAEMFSTPGTWCQGNFALDKWGVVCDPRNENTEKVCLLTAVGLVYGDKPLKLTKVKEKLFTVLGGHTATVEWNDDLVRTQDDVLLLATELHI